MGLWYLFVDLNDLWLNDVGIPEILALVNDSRVICIAVECTRFEALGVWNGITCKQLAIITLKTHDWRPQINCARFDLRHEVRFESGQIFGRLLR